MVPTLPQLPACFRLCGIAPVALPQHIDVPGVQRVFLAIEMAARLADNVFEAGGDEDDDSGDGKKVAASPSSFLRSLLI